jgi:hypothetical protein
MCARPDAAVCGGGAAINVTGISEAAGICFSLLRREKYSTEWKYRHEPDKSRRT